ncbi:MAG: hypothetical protein ACOX3R_02255 [Desulfitobacteriia bacterium]
MVKSFAPVRTAPSAIYASIILAIILVAKDAPTPALPSSPWAMTVAPAVVVLAVFACGTDYGIARRLR